MANPFMAGGAAVLLFIAQICLISCILLYELPSAQNSLADKIKASLPPKVVPVLVEYYPELNALTYDSAVSYCQYKQYADLNLNAEGITDDYVCEVVEGGLVSNTEELRLFLARRVIEDKVDMVKGIYWPQISKLQGLFFPMLLFGGFFAVFAFTLCFFGTKTLPECIFLFSVFSAFFAFGNMVIMGIAFLAAPGIVLGKAAEMAGSGVGRDVLSLMSGDIRGTIEGIFAAPMVFFGILSFMFGICSVIAYVVSIVPEQGKGRSKKKKSEN